MPRPKKNPEDVRDNPVVARLTDHEKRLLLALAEEEGLDYSTVAHRLIVKGLRAHMDILQAKLAERLSR